MFNLHANKREKAAKFNSVFADKTTKKCNNHINKPSVDWLYWNECDEANQGHN